MNIKTPSLLGHTPPILEVPAHQVWYRVQRATARKDSVRQKGYVLAPPGGLEAHYPVLQSMRYEASQKFAAACRQQRLHGVLYASAQHASHSCVCLFGVGIDRTKKLAMVDLVQTGTGLLHKAVVSAARGSQVPILRD